MKLTFVCIGNDELEHIQILLPQLQKLGDEVIYVDGESRDGSLEYAQKLGVKVLSKPRHPNAGVNRMAGFALATGDWIFYVDPDERFPEGIFTEFRQRIEKDPTICGFKLPRKNFYFGCWLKHGGQYPDHQVRLFKRGKGSFALKHVHDRLEVDGPIALLENAMEHYPYLTIAQFIKKFDFYSTFEAQFLDEKGVQVHFVNSLKYLFLKPHNRFLRRYFLKQGFRDGIPGFFAAYFDAIGWMTRYFKLWEIKKNKKS